MTISWSWRSPSRQTRQSAAFSVTFVIAILTGASLRAGHAEARHGEADVQQVREDTTRRVSVGTAVIFGTVMTADASPHPARRATMTLEGGGLVQRITITDDAGRFTFADLPPGTFSLTATRPAFVPAHYGARRPGGSGIPIAVAAGQRVDASMTMLPGAVLTGAVTDASNQRTPNATVRALSLHAGIDTNPVSVSTGTAVTDDRGVYRIYGLAPGDYRISVSPPPALTGANSLAALHAVTTSELQWAEASRAPGAGGTAGPPFGRAVGFTRVYYPGTPDPTEATTITLTAGEERTADIALRLVPMSSIAGVVLDPNGQPQARARVLLVRTVGDAMPETMPLNVNDSLNDGSLMVRMSDPDGTFRLAGLSPGTYRLLVRSLTPAGWIAVPPPAGSPAGLWGEVAVTAGGDDQTGLTVRLQSGATISGSIQYVGATTKSPTDLSPTVIALAQLPAVVASLTPRPTARVAADGSFTLVGVAPGRYQLVMTSAAPQGSATGVLAGPWIAKSAMLNGHDILDVPLDVAPASDVAGIVVTFTDRTDDVSGTVFDAQGRPTSTCAIIAFPSDRTLWINGSRRIKAVQPATNGSFRIDGLAAGEYRVAAVPDYEPWQLADPTFLDQLAAASLTVTLADGEHRALDVKLAGGIFH